MFKCILFHATIFCSITVFGQTATFSYQYHNEIAKAGKFTFKAPIDSLNIDAKASAGYLVAANNPYYQLTKNAGPIPNGTWEIYAIKNESLAILRLRPTEDVNMPMNSNGKPYRDGFLIHGTGVGQAPDEASTGCIILDKKERQKLVTAFKSYGIIKIKVTNILTNDLKLTSHTVSLKTKKDKSLHVSKKQNTEYLSKISKNVYFSVVDTSFRKTDQNLDAPPGETPLFVKVNGGELRVLMPPGNGVGVITFQVWFGGRWEVEVTVTNESGEVLCGGGQNEQSHKYNPVRVLLPVPQPFPAQGTIYIVKCKFKRAGYNPNLPWENAPVGVRGPGLTFAWWYPEFNDLPEPPTGDSKNGWAVVAKIGG